MPARFSEPPRVLEAHKVLSGAHHLHLGIGVCVGVTVIGQDLEPNANLEIYSKSELCGHLQYNEYLPKVRPRDLINRNAITFDCKYFSFCHSYRKVTAIKSEIEMCAPGCAL